jgi:hypothetical protein
VADLDPVWIKGRCKHLDPEPVMVGDPVTGDQIVAARLCLDCDTQLETAWTRDVLPEPNGFERWVYGDGPAINKRIPARPPWYVRAGRVYWNAYLQVWEGLKTGLTRFLETLYYMWPLYLEAAYLTLGRTK